MIFKGVIFDLDLTLVDTTAAEPYRKCRDWAGAYKAIEQCRVYDGIPDVLNLLRAKGIQTCIVSTAPRTYVERVIKAFCLPITHIVGYHDAKPIKPDRAPMLKALELLGCNPSEAISFGDRAIDIISSNGAGILSVACFWGTKERSLLEGSQPGYSIFTPNEILRFFGS